MPNRKTWKILAIVLVVLLLLALLANQWIKGKVNDKIEAISGLKVENTDVSVLRNSLALNGLVLSSDSLNVNGTCSELNIGGFHRLKFIRHDKIEIDDVAINGADIYIDLDEKISQNDQADSSNSPSIKIGNLDFKNGTLHLLKGKKEIAKIEEVFVRIQDAQFGGLDTFSIKDYFIRSGLITAHLPNDVHQIEVLNSEYNPDDEIMRFRGFRYFTDIPKDAWFETVEKKTSRIDLFITMLEIRKLDIPAFVNRKNIRAQRILLGKSLLEIYEDARFEHCQSCYKKLPHVSLMQSKQIIDIDSIQIKDSHIVYMSNEQPGEAFGRLDFAELYASVYHVSNTKSSRKKYPYIILDAQSDIYEKNPLLVHFEFDKNSPTGAYTYAGKLENFNMQNLNDFLKPSKLVAVRSGFLQRAEFDIRSSSEISKGKMDFVYKDLKVSLLNSDRFPDKKFMSGLLNGLAIRDDNMPGHRFRPGIVYFDPDPSRSMWHAMSQSLQAGIKSSAISKLFLPAELKE